MKCRSGLSYISVCWLIFAMSACMAAGGHSSKSALPVEVLISGRQCLPAPKSWTATWIASPDQFRGMISRCHANRFGSLPKPVPSIDFERFGVLVVEMGQQRSAGYGFEAEGVSASVENQTAIVRLECRRPPPGAITAQMLTSPWIMIRLPAGSYGNIRVVDQDSRFLARIEL